MITNCPVCGKGFAVLWPHLWRYKRNNAYLCSWKCLRLADNEREKEAEMDKPKQKRPRMTSDEMATAMQIWRDGGDIDTYLKEHGIGNIKKWKTNARARKPAETPKTVGDAMAAMKEAADNFFSQCEDMGLKTITDEDVEAIIPEVDLTIKSEDLFTEEEREFERRITVTAILVEGLGEFYHDRKFNTIDWRTEAGDEVSLGPLWWKQLAEDLPKILRKLGVDA